MNIINLACLLSLTAAPLYAKAPAAPRPAPAQRANTIAFTFYNAAAKNPGNIFFSPYSMRAAFAMAYEGANGQTAAEIEKVFAFGPDKGAARAALDALGKDAKAAAAGAEFTQANAFWTDKNYKFLPAYVQLLNRSYDAQAQTADFQADAEGARRAINAWTESRTKAKIKDLFQEGALTPLTRLVLVNAVYFKGQWKIAFDKKLTRPADFTLNSGEKKRAGFMTFTENPSLEYGEAGGVQVLRLPYKGGSLAMLIALPKDAASFARLERSLTQAKLDALRATLARQQVKVLLPRFTFSSAFQLNASLAALGMPTAFTDAADFSGMDGTRNLSIQKAVHKAFVEVNEEGTEAAAATGVAIGLKSMAFDLPEFRANKPFLFFIEDAKTGLLLFMGRMQNPEQK